MTDNAITFVVTVDGDHVSSEEIAQGFVNVLNELDAEIVHTNWTPDHDTVADGAGVAYENLVVVDLNNTREFYLPEVGVVSTQQVEGEQLERVSNSTAALDSAVRLVGAAIQPRPLEDLLFDALTVGQVAGVVTEIADIFNEWMDGGEPS